MGFRVLQRENGLVELQCTHGVGHPSKRLSNPKYYYATHGCDGCCSHKEFIDFEAGQKRIEIKNDLASS